MGVCTECGRNAVEVAGRSGTGMITSWGTMRSRSGSVTSFSHLSSIRNQ